MNNVTSASIRKLPIAGRDRSGTNSTTIRPVVFLRQDPAGHWILADEADRKGGLFGDRKSALKFIRDEFGMETTLVIQPRFDATDVRSQARDVN